MTAPPDPPIVSPGPGRWRRWWPKTRLVVAAAAVGVAIWAIAGKTTELSGVGGYLDHLSWPWMGVSVVAELLCYVALSTIQRRLLHSGGVAVPARHTLGITLAGSAIQNSFPGGSVVYLAYLFRQFRRWGADDVLSGWVVLAFNVVTFAALALLAAVGLGAAAAAGSTYDLVEAILGIFLAAAVAVLIITERRRVVPHLTRLVRLAQRIVHHPDPTQRPEVIVSAWTEQLTAVSPTPNVWAGCAVMGLANWIADCSCLAMAFLAVGVGVPWRGLLLAYGAGQLASTLPITPGGLGAVEGSLTVALVTFGGGEESTVAAVLLYRLVSFWMMLPIGWGSWCAVAVSGRRRARSTGTALAASAGGASPGSGAARGGIQ